MTRKHLTLVNQAFEGKQMNFQIPGIKGQTMNLSLLDPMHCHLQTHILEFPGLERDTNSPKQNLLSFEPIQAPLLIRSRPEAMKKVNSQLSLSPGIESEECSKLPCSHPSLDIEASKASTASTNPFPVLGGLCSEAISSINSWLGISLIHHPSRRGAIRSQNHGSRTKKSPQWKLQSNLLTLHPQRSRRIKFIDPITGEGNKTCFPRSTTKEAADTSPSSLIVLFQRVKHLISGSVNRERMYSPSDPLAPVGLIME